MKTACGWKHQVRRETRERERERDELDERRRFTKEKIRARERAGGREGETERE